MITGSMSARVNVTVEKIVEVSKENIIKHFEGIPIYKPHFMRLGNQETIKKEEVFERFGITIL